VKTVYVVSVEAHLIRCCFCSCRDLSYNTGLTGTIPAEIGNMKNLKSL